MKTSLALTAAALLCACATTAPARPEGCAAISSANWAAWIAAMPGPERPHLIVTGDVTVPTGGYRIALELGPTLRSQPPIQHVLLRITPPVGPATQAIVTHQARGRFPALPSYRSVVVLCGGHTIAEIARIETAH